MKNKSLFDLSISLTFFFIIVLSFFLYIDNLNYLHHKNSFIQNTIDPNSGAGDSYNFFYDKNDDIFKKYLDDIVYTIEIGKFYPSNNYNFAMFTKLFDRNLYLIYAFNLFFYLYFFFKFTFFFKKKNLVTYCILSSLNILILGSLSIPNKDILCYFSFNAILLYYLKRNYKFLFIAFFFGAVSRHEIIILYILILIINSNFFLQINNFLIKKSKFFFIIFTYILMYLISLFFFIITIDYFIFIKYFFFYIFKIFFFYILLRSFIKKIDNYLFCKISYLALFIIFLSIFVTKYYWFTGSAFIINDNTGSYGLSKLIYEISLKGFLFIVYPFKILISLFGNVFQKINFTSYETILSYWSQLLFFILFFFIIVKRNFTKNLDFLFVILPTLIVFSMPAFHTHRYVWFVYQYFVLTSLLYKDIKK